MTMKTTIAVVMTCGLVTLPAVPALAKHLIRTSARSAGSSSRTAARRGRARDEAEEDQAREAAQKARREAEGARAPHADDDLGGDEPDSLDTH